jgi:7-cyano-7-deazaguanine tRNA-ribosyltransferase
VLIAEHNLAVLREELLEIKQRIYEGTLWEYLEIKARSHPTLYRFLQTLRRYRRLLESFDPETHPRPHGLLFFHDTASSRPEPLRHTARLMEVEPAARKAVVLRVDEKPYNRSWQYRVLKDVARDCVHVLFFDPIFGIVPEEVAEVYPLSQNDSEGENEESRAYAYEWLNRYDVVYVYNVDISLVAKKVVKAETFEELVQLARCTT